METVTLQLSLLPNELQALIFSFLNVDDLSLAKQVCKHMLNLSNDHSLWKLIFINHWGMSVPQVDNFFFFHKSLRDISLCLEQEKKNFILLFEQDDKILFPQKCTGEGADGKEITLNKAPWKFIFLFSRYNLKWLRHTDFGVYVNLSPIPKDDFHVSAYLTGRAEEDMYGEHCILISPYSGLLFYYELKDDHTFSTIEKTDQFYICKRNVDMFVIPSDGIASSIDNNFPYDDLYMMLGERALRVTGRTSKQWVNGERITIHFNK